eukprot:NODE_1591_length_831_cov_237.255754_g1234_i0.p1 GENE.NODE_1591_length_831_cov_237.255754_g1234_i0~~NODE_1591_length_831_cov_237.255754_g1234_i0.p1  ORF type:complete len:186 (+),score=29.50 NODE_1591_length_831_cov_237.255754_g1234_i0:60-617(+)
MEYPTLFDSSELPSEIRRVSYDGSGTRIQRQRGANGWQPEEGFEQPVSSAAHASELREEIVRLRELLAEAQYARDSALSENAELSAKLVRQEQIVRDMQNEAEDFQTSASSVAMAHRQHDQWVADLGLWIDRNHNQRDFARSLKHYIKRSNTKSSSATQGTRPKRISQTPTVTNAQASSSKRANV